MLEKKRTKGSTDPEEIRGGISEKPRKAYEKPQLMVIDLTAREILAIGCKVSGSSGGPVTLCDFCGGAGS